MMKLGAWTKIGAFLRLRHSNPSNVGSARCDCPAKTTHGQPVEACRIALAKHPASRANETKTHRRSAPAEMPNLFTHAPINANAKNQPGIAQRGAPRPPQSGVKVTKTIAGRMRQSKKRRRSSRQ